MEKYIESGYVDVDYVVGNVSADVFRSRIEMDVVETPTTIEYRFNIISLVTGQPIRLKYSTDVILSDGKVITIPDSMSEYTYTIDKVTKIKGIEFETSPSITNVDATFVEFDGKKIELIETDDGKYILKEIVVTQDSVSIALGENASISLTSGEKIFLKKTETKDFVEAEKDEIPKLLKIKTQAQDTGEELFIKPKNTASNIMVIEKETTVGLVPRNIFHTNDGAEMIEEMAVGDETIVFQKMVGAGRTYYKLNDLVSVNRLKAFKDLKQNFIFREFE